MPTHHTQAAMDREQAQQGRVLRDYYANLWTPCFYGNSYTVGRKDDSPQCDLTFKTKVFGEAQAECDRRNATDLGGVPQSFIDYYWDSAMNGDVDRLMALYSDKFYIEDAYDEWVRENGPWEVVA